MKIVHWTMFNSSGMNAVAETMAASERAIGLDSHCANAFSETRESLISRFRDADIHVSHTYFPDWFRRTLTRPYKLVWVAHGTPEHVFFGSVRDGHEKPHGMNDGFMLQQYYLQHADAIVTHWPRHQAIFRTQVDKKTPVHLVPMGVDKTFWKPVPSRGRFAGHPSLLSAENCHEIKWPYDLLISWGLAHLRLKNDAALHLLNLPYDLHRWFFPLANRNGSAYASHLSNVRYFREDLRNAFCSVDYYIGLVQKGDFNRNSLEANACGCRTISYAGNPYSDFWVPEGDQRTIADVLVRILHGKVKPRKKDRVVSAITTAKQMRHIYATC